MRRGWTSPIYFASRIVTATGESLPRAAAPFNTMQVPRDSSLALAWTRRTLDPRRTEVTEATHSHT